MKRILLNATQTEETRVAIVDGQYLYDLDIESLAQNKRKSNIYKGKVTRVEASLEAAFVDYGADRHGFLPLKEIARSLFPEGGGKRTIQQALREGQELIVQVEKEERGNKGAALTTQVSLAGRYLVLMPRTEGSGGISRKVESRDRDELRETMDGVEIPSDMSAIARTMALGRSQEELQWDLNYLLELWNSITAAAESKPAPFLIYQETNIVSRTIRDHLRSDVSDVIIDDPAVYAEAVEFMQQLMPQNLSKLKLYEDSIPLFTRYQIENQIETAHQRSVNLRSGGSIVIDLTEALTSIDINSARATQGSDIEETAFRTNMEAAEEIARQLRLRDLGGLLVIDFIDMNSSRNQREVENCLREATKVDRARIQIGKISRFGLLEMSRQRLGASLREISAINCPRCDGQGTIRTVESLALYILRLIEDEANKERTARISVQVPVAVATFLFNEKRDVLADLDKRLGMQALILPNPSLETPHYDIQRTRVQDLNKTLLDTSSFDLPVIEGEEQTEPQNTKTPERPAVTPITRVSPPPSQESQTKKPGLLARLFGSIGSTPEPEPAPRKTTTDKRKSSNRSGRNGENRTRSQDSRNNSGSKRNEQRRSSKNQQDGSSNRQSGNRKPNKEQSKEQNKDQNKSDDQRQQQTAGNNDGQRDSSRSGNRRSRGNRGGRSGKSSRPTDKNENSQAVENPDQRGAKQANTGKQTPPPTETASSPEKPVAAPSEPAAQTQRVAPQRPASATAKPAEPASENRATAEQASEAPQPAHATSAPLAAPAPSQTSAAEDRVAPAKKPARAAAASAQPKSTTEAPRSTDTQATTPVAAKSPPVTVKAEPAAPTTRETAITKPTKPAPSAEKEASADNDNSKPAAARTSAPPVKKPAVTKTVPGQIETRKSASTATPAPEPVKRKPAPRPTQWTAPVENPGTTKQIETGDNA